MFFTAISIAIILRNNIPLGPVCWLLQHSGGPSGLCTTKLASKAQIYDPASSPTVAAITQILPCKGWAIQSDQESRAACQLFICLDPALGGCLPAHCLFLHADKEESNYSSREARTHH